MKELSIITICYNEPNLEATCQSIINQTWQDFEWIVIDGGSNPETQAVWDKYKDRINKFISEKDKGIYNAMNKGIKLATGKYLNFMNAGDSFYDNQVLRDTFESKKQTADVLYGDYSYSKGTKYQTICKFPPKILKYFWTKAILNHQSTFIKRKLFKKYGLYDEHLKILADYDIFLRFYTNNATFEHINRIIALFGYTGISSREENLKDKEFRLIKERYFPKDVLQEAAREWENTNTPSLAGHKKYIEVFRFLK